MPLARARRVFARRFGRRSAIALGIVATAVVTMTCQAPAEISQAGSQPPETAQAGNPPVQAQAGISPAQTGQAGNQTPQTAPAGNAPAVDCPVNIRLVATVRGRAGQKVDWTAFATVNGVRVSGGNLTALIDASGHATLTRVVTIAESSLPGDSFEFNVRTSSPPVTTFDTLPTPIHVTCAAKTASSPAPSSAPAAAGAAEPSPSGEPSAR